MEITIILYNKESDFAEKEKNIDKFYNDFDGLWNYFLNCIELFSNKMGDNFGGVCFDCRNVNGCTVNFGCENDYDFVKYKGGYQSFDDLCVFKDLYLEFNEIELDDISDKDFNNRFEFYSSKNIQQKPIQNQNPLVKYYYKLNTEEPSFIINNLKKIIDMYGLDSKYYNKVLICDYSNDWNGSIEKITFEKNIMYVYIYIQGDSTDSTVVVKLPNNLIQFLVSLRKMIDMEISLFIKQHSVKFK